MKTERLGKNIHNNKQPVAGWKRFVPSVEKNDIKIILKLFCVRNTHNWNCELIRPFET